VIKYLFELPPVATLVLCCGLIVLCVDLPKVTIMALKGIVDSHKLRTDLAKR
jgi:hypothetical protein